MKINKVELQSLLREVMREEIHEMMHPDDEADMAGDGYSNDHQRAFAHSQATTPRKNETQKAIELAKQGKFVLTYTADVHCRTTDAVLGCDISIQQIFDSEADAQKYIANAGIGASDDSDGWNLITPDSVKEKPKADEPPSGPDDVPFQQEGYGAGDLSKDKKQAFKGAHWTVKYEAKVPLQEVTSIIRELIKEEQAVAPVSSAPGITADHIKQMRDWVKECLPWRDLETDEEVDDLSVEELLKGVHRSYEGGLKAFIRDCEPVSKLDEEATGWKPLPLPQDANQIAGLIHGLKEGIGIFFSYDNKTGHQGSWIHIKCVAEGDYITYRVDSNDTDKKELESEEEINAMAQEIATGGFHFYSIEPLQDYKKSTYRQEDPTGQDDDIEYPPDREEPQFESSHTANNFFIITGRSGPQTTYFCSSATQGEKMIPSAGSMAYRFTDKSEAQKKLQMLQSHYKGIQNWNIEPVSDEADKPMYESSRPLYEAKGSTAREKVKSIIREVLKKK